MKLYSISAIVTGYSNAEDLKYRQFLQNYMAGRR